MATPSPTGPRLHRPGERHTGRPPPPTHPPARERLRRAGPPDWGYTAPSQVGGKRDRAPPPPKRKNQTEQGTGAGGTEGLTDRVERHYQGPAPEPREVRAPHQPGEGGGVRTSRERERTHTQRTRGEYQKGNRTEPAERTDRMEWRTSDRGQGTTRRDGPQHTAQDTRGRKGETGRTQHQAPA